MFVNILWNTVNTVIIIIKICLCHFLIFKILFQCENNRKLTTFNERKKINTRHRVMLFLSAMIAAKEYTSISVLHRKSKSFHTMWNYSDYGKFSRGTYMSPHRKMIFFGGPYALGWKRSLENKVYTKPANARL